jgi:hypothetical protein
VAKSRPFRVVAAPQLRAAASRPVAARWPSGFTDNIQRSGHESARIAYVFVQTFVHYKSWLEHL